MWHFPSLDMFSFLSVDLHVGKVFVEVLWYVLPICELKVQSVQHMGFSLAFINFYIHFRVHKPELSWRKIRLSLCTDSNKHRPLQLQLYFVRFGWCLFNLEAHHQSAVHIRTAGHKCDAPFQALHIATKVNARTQMFSILDPSQVVLTFVLSLHLYGYNM